MEDRYWALLDTAVEQQHRTPEGEYLTTVNKIAADREIALNELALRLTRVAVRAFNAR